jgi:hypothetical protein
VVVVNCRVVDEVWITEVGPLDGGGAAVVAPQIPYDIVDGELKGGRRQGVGVTRDHGDNENDCKGTAGPIRVPTGTV